MIDTCALLTQILVKTGNFRNGQSSSFRLCSLPHKSLIFWANVFVPKTSRTTQRNSSRFGIESRRFASSVSMAVFLISIRRSNTRRPAIIFLRRETPLWKPFVAVTQQPEPQNRLRRPDGSENDAGGRVTWLGRAASAGLISRRCHNSPPNNR